MGKTLAVSASKSLVPLLNFQVQDIFATTPDLPPGNMDGLNSCLQEFHFWVTIPREFNFWVTILQDFWVPILQEFDFWVAILQDFWVTALQEVSMCRCLGPKWAYQRLQVYVIDEVKCWLNLSPCFISFTKNYIKPEIQTKNMYVAFSVFNIYRKHKKVIKILWKLWYFWWHFNAFQYTYTGCQNYLKTKKILHWIV